MKKNILVVQTLLVLPLIHSSNLSSMQQQPKTPLQKKQMREEKKKTYREKAIQQETQKPTDISDAKNNLIAELEASFVTRNKNTDTEQSQSNKLTYAEVATKPAKTLPTATNNQHENINFNEFPFFSEMTQEAAAATTESLPNDLLQSAIIPQEKKGFGILGSISYYIRDSIKNLISYLQNNSFDTSNASHFALLHEAIKKAIANNDFDSLATITALCQSTEEYQSKIRISDDIAEPTFNFCSTRYSEHVVHANKKLETNYQNNILQYNARTAALSEALQNAINSYNQDIKNITNEYDTLVEQETNHLSNLQKQISIIAALNKQNRKDAPRLLAAHTINAPKNQFPKELTQKKLNSVLLITDHMPQIKVPESDLSSNLALNNK